VWKAERPPTRVRRREPFKPNKGSSTSRESRRRTAETLSGARTPGPAWIPSACLCASYGGRFIREGSTHAYTILLGATLSSPAIRLWSSAIALGRCRVHGWRLAALRVISRLASPVAVRGPELL
jgi:hypothetical protein